MSHPTTQQDQSLRIAVIIGSTREGRLGASIAKWFVGQVVQRDDIAVDLVDLAQVQLPVVLPDAEEVPDAVTALGERLAAADGFVVVTPEYNHSFPASLKNAIDWFYYEWSAKPVGFVSYGGRAQGIRAVEQLRQVFVEVHATTTRDGVSIDLETVDDSGWPLPSAGLEAAAKQSVDQLAWWARALRDARTVRPYQG